MQLKDRKALVTGGAQGLGEALTERLIAEGCDVAIADIKFDQAKEVADKLSNRSGRKVIAVQMNVADEASVQAAYADIMAQFEKLDIVVANAGILKAHGVEEFPANEWKLVMDVNLYGYFLVAKEACKVMMEQKSGSIIQINSKSGKKGSFKNSAYAASKFGGIGLTQSLALEMAPYGVRVNAICPGNLLDGTLWQESLFEQYAKTQGLTVEQVKKKYMDQVPLGRGCMYDDVANVVVFLSSEQSSYMTGQAINVTGGQEMR